MRFFTGTRRRKKATVVGLGFFFITALPTFAIMPITSLDQVLTLGAAFFAQALYVGLSYPNASYRGTQFEDLLPVNAEEEEESIMCQH